MNYYIADYVCKDELVGRRRKVSSLTESSRLLEDWTDSESVIARIKRTAESRNVGIQLQQCIRGILERTGGCAWVKRRIQLVHDLGCRGDCARGGNEKCA